jgi:hypothetical protein
MSHQKLVHAGEEKGRVGSLDDAVVVGGGEHDDLSQTELCDHLGIGGSEFGRVPEGPDPNDRSLS